MYPLVAISTLPRVGSMWATNVARMLALKANLKVIPDPAIRREKDMLAVAGQFLRMNANDVICIIKVHTALNQKQNLKVIYIKRNVRDRIFSMCRFEDKPLTENLALKMVMNDMRMDAHYENWPSSQILRISYDSLETDSRNLIHSIANFMQITSVNDDDIKDINTKLSKSQVKKKVSQMDGIVSGGADNLGQSSLSKVEGASGVIRAFDDTTGFQSGHVSDYRAGDWQHLWSDEQKQLVDGAIRIATENRQK